MFRDAHNKLYRWYQRNGRHTLPWRQTEDAYRIYISEIMLQQTQVATVLERFYHPFLERFPTLESLADASLDEVLKSWEGLGYYRRARNLHSAAKLAVPQMPATVEGLLALPGVGRSTAHAVASFAYRIPVPILDANVKRILYRIFARKDASEKELWQLADDFFDARYPYEFNQAMMDLGSALCGKKPLCSECPLSAVCLARDLNPLEYPARKIKKAVPVKERAIVIFLQGERVGVEQRAGEFLHGLWGFRQYEGWEGPGELIGEVVQKYTHFHLYAKVYLFFGEEEGLTWVQPHEAGDLALSTVDHKVLALLSRCDSVR